MLADCYYDIHDCFQLCRIVVFFYGVFPLSAECRGERGARRWISRFTPHACSKEESTDARTHTHTHHSRIAARRHNDMLIRMRADIIIIILPPIINYMQHTQHTYTCTHRTRSDRALHIPSVDDSIELILLRACRRQARTLTHTHPAVCEICHVNDDDDDDSDSDSGLGCKTRINFN